MSAFESAFDAGRFDDAVAALAAGTGRRFRPAPSLDVRLDARQDLLYAPRWRRPQDRAGDRRTYAWLARAGRSRPACGRVEVLKGILRLYLDDLPGAERRLLRGQALSPDCSWGFVFRYACRALLARRRHEVIGMLEVACDLDRALRLDPRNRLALSLRAEMLHDRDLRDAALRDITALLELDPESEWARAERGEILTERGDLAAALADFDWLAARHPAEAWPLALRARALANSGRLREGLAGFDRAVGLEPRSGALRAWRAEARRKAGDGAGALADFDRAVRLQPGYALARAWRGRLHLAAGRSAAARADLEAAVRIDCRHALLHAWRGEALFKLGRFREAALAFDRLYPFHPRNSWSPPADQPELPRAEALERSLDEALRRRPDSAWAWAIAGAFRLESPSSEAGAPASAFSPSPFGRGTKGEGNAAGMGDPQAGTPPAGVPAACLERAAALDPGCAWAVAWRGEARRRAGRAAEALADFDRAAALDPVLPWPRLWRALMRLRSGAAAAAAEDLRVVLARWPECALALRLRGEAALRLGRRAEARADFERAFLLQPNDQANQAWYRKTAAVGEAVR